MDLHTNKDLDDFIDEDSDLSAQPDSEYTIDVKTIRNYERIVIDKEFGSKEAHIFYSDELAQANPILSKLEKKELPNFSIIFPDNNPNTFIINRVDTHAYRFTDEFDPNDVVSLIKMAVVQNRNYFNNNHVSIYIHNKDQSKYIPALKNRFLKVKEYVDSD